MSSNVKFSAHGKTDNFLQTLGKKPNVQWDESWENHLDIHGHHNLPAAHHEGHKEHPQSRTALSVPGPWQRKY